MAELVISATRDAPRSGRPDPGGAHRLLLDERSLRSPDGAARELQSFAELDAARAAAQGIAEAALGAWGGGPVGAERTALLTAAVTKISVYGEAEAYLSAAHLVGRATALLRPERIVWRTARPALAARVLDELGLRRSARIERVATRREGPAGAALAWLKRHQLDWTARSLAGMADALRSRPAGLEPGAVLSVFDVRNEGMIENVALVAEALRAAGVPTAGVFMDRRVGAAARARAPGLPQVPLAAFARALDAARALERLAGARKALRALDDAGASGPALAARRFAWRTFGAPYVLQTMVDISATERLLDALRPKAIVVASDAHRYARLLVLLARERGVPTAVLQHGALGFEHFYVPIVAEHMFAWGPWCRDWFVARGGAPLQVHACGFVRAPERCAPRGVPRAGELRLLFAAQPIPDDMTADLLDLVRRALAADEQLRLVVRPHPGESRRAALGAIVAAWPAALRRRVALSARGRPLAADFEAADVCVVSQSTVGIDALLAGLPVILLRHARIRDSIPFREFGCVLAAADAASLADALARLRDPAQLSALAARASAFLDAYVGHGGPAAIRATAALIADAALGAGTRSARAAPTSPRDARAAP